MVVGSIHPRSPGSSKLENPSRRQRREPPPARRREPSVIRYFDASCRSDEKIPSFTCTSGELLWGQLQTVFEASKSDQRDTTDGPYESGPSGTILQSSFRYRANARKGVWKVEPVFIDDWHVGYVCHHEDFDGLNVVREAAKVGRSLANDHENRNIVYVNRYDWGRWVGPSLQVLLDAIGCKKSEDEILDESPSLVGYEYESGWESDYVDELTDMEVHMAKKKAKDDAQARASKKCEYFTNWFAFRFMLLDPEGIPTLIQAMKEGEELKRKNYLFHYPSGTSGQPGNEAEAVRFAPASVDPRPPFGVNVVTSTFEHELAWMKFEKGELVGFVYDGEYSDLDVSEGKELKVGGIVAKELGAANEDSDWEEDPHFVHYRSPESEDSELDMSEFEDSDFEEEDEVGRLMKGRSKHPLQLCRLLL
ncbi:hypothetical protein R1sor_019556 [Riccia sorocarpa]|uniref:Uncharacterized protein n=1 Tax=Riccia sorocarpa TaxID=122646 RepID=A0ABD3IG47_9MARC